MIARCTQNACTPTTLRVSRRNHHNKRAAPLLRFTRSQQGVKGHRSHTKLSRPFLLSSDSFRLEEKHPKKRNKFTVRWDLARDYFDASPYAALGFRSRGFEPPKSFGTCEFKDGYMKSMMYIQNLPLHIQTYTLHISQNIILFSPSYGAFVFATDQ